MVTTNGNGHIGESMQDAVQPYVSRKNEWVGDSILSLVTREVLMSHQPPLAMGEMNDYFQRLTRNETLYRFAVEQGLAVNKTDKSSGKIIEQIAGYLYRIGGIRFAARFLKPMLNEELRRIIAVKKELGD